MARTTCILPTNRAGRTARYYICDFISDLPTAIRQGDMAVVGSDWYVSTATQWVLVGSGTPADTTAATGIISQVNVSASQIRRGQPVASVVGGVVLASNVDLSFPAVGVAAEGIGVGTMGRIVTAGIVDLNDWTYPAGTANLVQGAAYYLGPDGSIVVGRPATVVQPIGQAVTATALSLGLAPIRPAALDHIHVTENMTLTVTDIANKFVLLAQTPLTGSVIMAIQGAAFQRQGYAWAADGTNPKKITWSGFTLDGLLEAGDNITFMYQKLP